MPFSYVRLWKLLLDKGMTKEQLRRDMNFSSTTIAKMGKGENVSLDVIEKICTYFDCRIEDIMEYVPDHDQKNRQP